jgi:hypothetical protein
VVVVLVLWPAAGLVAALTQLDDVCAGALYLASVALLAVVAVAVLALGRGAAQVTPLVAPATQLGTDPEIVTVYNDLRSPSTITSATH